MCVCNVCMYVCMYVCVYVCIYCVCVCSYFGWWIERRGLDVGTPASYSEVPDSNLAMDNASSYWGF